MATRYGVRFACSFALLFMAVCGTAQEWQQSALPANTSDALHAMSRLAGVIFTGQVVSLRRNDGGNDASGVVEIDFAVEDAVRGVSGSVYTVREWAGLWRAGDQPFRVGQRYLMLLHAPSATGLSSPVGGQDGAIPIRGSVQTPGSGPAESIVRSITEPAAASALPESCTVDLRWVATRVVQPLPYASQSAVNPTGLTVPVVADALGLQPVSISQTNSYSSVLAMLRGWEKTDHAAH